MKLLMDTPILSHFVQKSRGLTYGILVVASLMVAQLAGAQSAEQANIAYSEGRYGEAIRAYQRLLLADESNRAYRWRLANSLYIRQAWSKAIKQLRILLIYHPYDEEALNLLAIAAEQSQLWSDASWAYFQLFIINPENTSVEAGLQRVQQAQLRAYSGGR